MQAILHLGTYKTGSSSLQNLLFDNREILKSKKILYPENGIVPERHIGFRHTKLIFDYINNKNPACPIELKNEILHSQSKKTIFSSEAWANPSHLNHLSHFTESLKDIGFQEIQFIAFARNIIQYKISLYREFTVNQKNVLNYLEFTQRMKGIFNLLYIAQAFKAINSNRLTLIPFDGQKDIRAIFFQKIDESDTLKILRDAELANVKKTDALDVEAIRCANRLKIPSDVALEVAQLIRSGDPSGVWTEFSTSPDDQPGSSYQKTFQSISGWSSDLTERLFQITPPPGESVYKLTPRIMSEFFKMVEKK